MGPGRMGGGKVWEEYALSQAEGVQSKVFSHDWPCRPVDKLSKLCGPQLSHFQNKATNSLLVVFINICIIIMLTSAFASHASPFFHMKWNGMG